MSYQSTSNKLIHLQSQRRQLDRTKRTLEKVLKHYRVAASVAGLQVKKEADLVRVNAEIAELDAEIALCKVSLGKI